MAGRLKLELSEAQRAELEDLRDHSSLPYLRERAAALLKIASGLSGREVARHRLNRAHWQDTIYEWVQRYKSQGLPGLRIKPGRGRKPAFSPQVPRPTDRETSFSPSLSPSSAGCGSAEYPVAVSDPAPGLPLVVLA